MPVKEFAEKFIKAENKAWKTGNCDALEALENPNVVYHQSPADVMGWEAHKQYILMARQATSDLKQEWEYLTGAGNLFALSYKMNCIVTRELMGIPPGKKVTNDSIFVVRLARGKIAETWIKGAMTVSDK